MNSNENLNFEFLLKKKMKILPGLSSAHDIGVRGLNETQVSTLYFQNFIIILKVNIFGFTGIRSLFIIDDHGGHVGDIYQEANMPFTRN